MEEIEVTIRGEIALVTAAPAALTSGSVGTYTVAVTADPEAILTVEDGGITEAKLEAGLLAKLLAVDATLTQSGQAADAAGTSAAISAAVSDKVTTAGMTAAISEAVADKVTTAGVTAAISAAVADKVTTAGMTSAIDAAVAGMATTTYVDTAIQTAIQAAWEGSY